ncbi:FliG C-terminal domain-containing protein [Oceanospirillum beijerinckii]|uniref:FliG C-terminal domain-containing protein n=1 Tax=Oceanospirillum beijerinckii TaxID=64976 RepID=UPI0003FFBEA0|nr:FliG C-terminal domain-containing protein [Oceanospirillum beijerinckii]
MSFDVRKLGEHTFLMEKEFFSMTMDLVDGVRLLSKLDEQLGLNPPLSQGEPNFIPLYRNLLKVLTYMDQRSMQMLMHAASRDLLVNLMRTVKGTKLESRLMSYTTKRNKQAIETDVLYNKPINPNDALQTFSDFFQIVEDHMDKTLITLVDPNGEYY